MTDEALPTVVSVTQAFTSRLPTQRMIDTLARIESGVSFPELATNQPFRLIAFRKLLADYPDRDVTSLWMHSYDVEVDVTEVDPFSSNGPTPTPPSADIGAALQAT